MLNPILITLGQSLGPAPAGRVSAPLPLRFPNKMPAAIAQYGVECAPILSSDTLKAASISVLPVGVDAISLGTPVISGSQVLFSVSGGVANTDYGLTLLIVTASGVQYQYNLGLYVSSYQYPGAV
jgi:hypothetical protein